MLCEEANLPLSTSNNTKKAYNAISNSIAHTFFMPLSLLAVDDVLFKHLFFGFVCELFS